MNDISMFIPIFHAFLFMSSAVIAWMCFIWKIAAIIVPLLGAAHVTFIIVNDEFLYPNIIFPLTLTLLFTSTSCLLTLSKICALRRKPHAEDKTVDQLWDTDLIYENDTDVAPHYNLSYHYKDIGNTLKNFIFKNPLEFCMFRPAYGMLLATGFVFLFAFAAALTQIEEWSKKDDYFCAALELTVPMILLISGIYFIANSGIYTTEKDNDLYTPFEEYTQIPMKIIVGKTVALFVTSGGTYWLLTLLMLSATALAIIFSNLYHAFEIDHVLKSLLPPIYPDPRMFLRTILIVIIVVCINALIGMVVTAFFEAKVSILGIIEKNWQRNLGAISFLLQDTEAKTLQDLKNALEHKKSTPLTEKEKAAFNYISWPIWRTKQPFMLRKFEDDAPKYEIPNNKELDDLEDNSEYFQQPNVDVEQDELAHTDKPSQTNVDEGITTAEPEVPKGGCVMKESTSAVSLEISST